MSPTSALPGPATASNDPVAKAGFFLLSVYFFFNYSRILDVTVPSLHLPLLVGVALYGTATLAGGIQRALATTPGKVLTALTGVMFLAAIFGAWPGGSIDVLMNTWSKAFPLYFTVVAVCLTTEQIFQFLKTICLALAVMSAIALWRGDNILGRLRIDDSRFADPNDLAMICLIGAGLCCFLITRSKSMFGRLGAIGLLGIILYAFSRTGSRGAMMGFAAGILYLFFKTSVAGKIKMLVVMAAMILVAVLVLPPKVYLRYVGMISDTTDADVVELDVAEASSEARLSLLQESLWMTLRHPLLGVGPGNFAVVENDTARAKGYARGSWHETHNMYTQVSSENGVLAALMYIAVLVLGLRATRRTIQVAKQHPKSHDVEKAAFWMRVATIMFAVSGSFLSVGYSDILPLMSGLAIALELAVLNEVRVASKTAGAVVQVRPFTPAFAGMRR